MMEVEGVIRNGNGTLDGVVHCLISTNTEVMSHVRSLFAARMPNAVLTLVAMPGEWPGFNVSATCTGLGPAVGV